MDIRIISTKKRIQKGLIQSISKTSLYLLKDRDIISAAQVSSSSYYKYYGDKGEVLKDLEQELLAEFKTAIIKDSTAWRKITHSPSKKDIEYKIDQNLVSLIDFFDNKKEALTALTSDNGDIGFQDQMISTTTDIIEKLIVFYYRLYDQQSLVLKQELRLRITAKHYAVALLGPLFFWLRHASEMTIRNVKNLIIEMIMYSPYDITTHRF